MLVRRGGSKGERECACEEALSRAPRRCSQGPLPGGYTVGEQLYFINKGEVKVSMTKIEYERSNYLKD